jgi:hypothetical protein
MPNKTKLAVVTTAAVMLVVPMFGAVAKEASTEQQQYWPYMRMAKGCPLHRAAGGAIVDCHGWRLRSTVRGWDNSCFNLDYLPSSVACTSR